MQKWKKQTRMYYRSGTGICCCIGTGQMLCVHSPSGNTFQKFCMKWYYGRDLDCVMPNWKSNSVSHCVFTWIWNSADSIHQPWAETHRTARHGGHSVTKQSLNSRSHGSRLWSTSEQSASLGLNLPATSASGHATAAPASAALGLGSTPINGRIADIDPSHRRHSPWLGECPCLPNFIQFEMTKPRDFS